MTTYNINIFGKTHRYDLLPVEIIYNVCESLAGQCEVEYLDGWKKNVPSQDKFCEECYKTLMRENLDLYLDGIEITIKTPKEVRFFGESGIYKIALEVWNNQLGSYPEEIDKEVY